MVTYEVLVGGKLRRIELSRNGEHSFTVRVDGKPVSVELQADSISPGEQCSLSVGGKEYAVILPRVDWEKPFEVKVDGTLFKAELKMPSARTVIPSSASARSVEATKTVTREQAAEGSVTAPMTGKIVSVRVRKGDLVKSNQVLCVIEAMKMENEICAPSPGTVQEVLVTQGSSVNEGDTLFIIG
jgi:biotin carboxyl carrier protein